MNALHGRRAGRDHGVQAQELATAGIEAQAAPRVLMVMHLPASMELGGARVQLELADVLRDEGCEVRVLAREEILGGRRAGRLGISPDAFPAAAVRSVRAIADGFDVIDAHQGNLPVSKRRLGFGGLMVTRSVGLAPLYQDSMRSAKSGWPLEAKAHPLARPVRRWRKRRFLRHVATTFRTGDLLIVPNRDELAYLSDHFDAGEKTVVLPLGISEQRLEELRPLIEERDSRGPRVAFIGDWNARKGAYDWPDIFARVRRALPQVSFTFLGTHAARADLAAALGVDADAIEVVPSYDAGSLAGLLTGVRVGALPSYVEGLGLGVLEKMAAGIPSVCYDVPGPRDTIGQVDRGLLVPVGDTEAFAERLVETLTLGRDGYQSLSDRCRSVAERFSWRIIGADTLWQYQSRLAALRAGVEVGFSR